MKSIVNYQAKALSKQAESSFNEHVSQPDNSVSLLDQANIPDMSEICTELSARAISNIGIAHNALQFVLDLNEMEQLKQSEIDLFIKNPQTNHVLIENEFLKIVLIHWLPGSISSIHGHPKGGGVFKVISGSIEELRYTTDAKPKLLSVSSYHKNAIGYIDDQLANHAVGNPYKESAISFHVYTRI